MAKETKKKEMVEKVEDQNVMPFGKQNYIIVLIGIALLALGFILMIGGGSDDPTVFSDKLFDARRLVVAPILIVGGLIVEIFAIMIRPKDKKEVEPETETAE